MDQHQFYYQPSPIYSTIDWCWTFILLLTGIIFWLEVTHVQWITIIFFIAFFIVGGLELVDRRLIIKNSVLIVKDMFNRQWHCFNLNKDANQIHFTKRLLTINKYGRKYQYCLLPRDIKEIKNIIQAVN